MCFKKPLSLLTEVGPRVDMIYETLLTSVEAYGCSRSRYSGCDGHVNWPHAALRFLPTSTPPPPMLHRRPHLQRDIFHRLIILTRSGHGRTDTATRPDRCARGVCAFHHLRASFPSLCALADGTSPSNCNVHPIEGQGKSIAQCHAPNFKHRNHDGQTSAYTDFSSSSTATQ